MTDTEYTVGCVTNGEGEVHGYYRAPVDHADVSVLMEAERLIRGDRRAEHGDHRETYRRVGEVWGALLGLHPIPTDRVLIMLAAMKLVRASVNPDPRDNYVDAAGYAALASER